MSQNQKLLKIMSLIAVPAGIGMAVWTSFSLFFANTPQGLLLTICMGVPAIFDLALGVYGIAAANRPARTEALYYVWMTWLALLLNIVAVVVIAFIGTSGSDDVVYAFISLGIPSVLNLVIVALYCKYARAVRIESLK